MSRHRATVTMPVATEDLYTWLRTVENWPRFLEGLHAVEALTYRRYRWSVGYAGRDRDVDVVVSLDPHAHRVAWRHTHRPRLEGWLCLTALNATRTRADLCIDIEPAGFLDGIVESTGMTGWMAERDLQRLRRLVLDGELRQPATT